MNLCSCAAQNSVNNLVKLLLIAPGRTWKHLDNIQHQLCPVGSFMIEAEITSGFQTAVGLIPLCGQSLDSLLFFESCDIHSTVNYGPICGIELRLLSKDSGFVLKSKS